MEAWSFGNSVFSNDIIDRLIHCFTITKITYNFYIIKYKLIDMNQQTKIFERAIKTISLLFVKL